MVEPPTKHRFKQLRGISHGSCGSKPRLAYCAHCSYFFREKVVRGLADYFFLVFLEAAENKNKTRLCGSRLVKTVQSVHEGGTVLLSGPSAVCPPVEK